MPELADYRKAGAELYEKLHLATYPVALKYIRDESEIPPKAVRPSQAKQKWSLCQAVTYSRRWGWTVAMTADDNFCTPATASHRWVDISADDLLQSQLFQAWHKDVEAEKKRLKHGLDQVGDGNLEKLSQYCGLVSSPLAHTPLIPDSILVFGNGENINHIIHALTYEGENYPTSTFEGFGETCIKGGLVPFITGIPQIVIPGMGDRTFSGVYDYEIAIGMPANLLFMAVENLFKSGGRLNLGNPVRTLLAAGINENITPGFKYLRAKMDEMAKENIKEK
jgi:uncharacterized protein (DUF169 family)